MSETVLWLLDLLLKYALGYAIVFPVWLLMGWWLTPGYEVAWLLAGGIVGGCIIGFFEGCSFSLAEWAKSQKKE